MRSMVMSSKDFQTKTNNKQYENSELAYSDYIETAYEPFDSEITSDISEEINLEMAETIYDMRREFKRTAKKLRKYYSNKEPKQSIYRRTNISKGHHFSNKRAVA